MALGKGPQDTHHRTQMAKAKNAAVMEGAGQDIETVPASATCKFVGEGRANLVFSLTDVDGHPSFKGKRARQATTNRKQAPD